MNRPILLLTRPKDSAIEFSRALRSDLLEDVRIVMSPLLEIAPTGVNPHIENYAGAIFTSSHGVNFAPMGEGRPAYCVGQTTKSAAEAKGWNIKQVSFTAEDLIAEMDLSQTKGPLVHLAGRHLRGDIVQSLTGMGIDIQLVTLYDQKLMPLSAEAQTVLKGDKPIIVPLFSPRTAAHFITQAEDLSLAHFVVMSTAVAKALNHNIGAGVSIAKAPTALEMRLCVEKLLAV